MVALCACISNGMEMIYFLLDVISALVAWPLLTLLEPDCQGEQRPTPDLEDRCALVGLINEQGGGQSNCLVLWLTKL